MKCLVFVHLHANEGNAMVWETFTLDVLQGKTRTYLRRAHFDLRRQIPASRSTLTRCECRFKMIPSDVATSIRRSSQIASSMLSGYLFGIRVTLTPNPAVVVLSMASPLVTYTSALLLTLLVLSIDWNFFI